MKTALKMPARLARLVSLTSRVLDIIVGGLLLIIVVVMLAQVIGRYALGSSLIWSEELTRLLHVWMVMLATIKASHMRINLFVERLSDRLKLLVRLFSASLSCAILALMIVGGLTMVELTAYDKYTGLNVSMKYVYVALVFAVVCWLPVILGQFFFPQIESE